MSLLLCVPVCGDENQCRGCAEPQLGQKHQSPSKRPLSRTVCWGMFDRVMATGVRHCKRREGREQRRGKGVTTPPQHYHHPLPLLCQTPLSAAPIPNFLPLPVKGLLWPLFMQFKCLHLANTTLSLIRCFVHMHHAAKESLCSNTMTSPSRTSYKFLPKIICHKLHGHAVTMRLMACIKYMPSKHGSLLWPSTLSMADLWGASLLCCISDWVGLLAHGPPFSFIFAQWALQYKTGALSWDTENKQDGYGKIQNEYQSF